MRIIKCEHCRKSSYAGYGWLVDTVSVPAFTSSGAVTVVHKTLCPVCVDRLLPEASMLSSTTGPVTYYDDGWEWFRRKRPETCAMCGRQLPADLSNLFYRPPMHTEVLGLCRTCASRVVRAEVDSNTLRLRASSSV